MRRKVAVMICAALIASMLGACGGSSGTSSGQAQAPAEEAAEETEEAAAPEAEAAEETAEAEAAPEADAETPAEDVVDAEAPAESTDAAEATTADVATGELTAGNGAALGVISPSIQSETTEFAAVADMDDPQQALGAAPDVESIEGLEGADGAALNAIVNVNGTRQELTSFYVNEADGIMAVANVIGNSSGVLTNFIEIYDFYKSAGFTRDDMVNININDIYPNFTSMSCAMYQIYDCGSIFRMYVGVTGLDDPDNVKEVIENGYLTANGYRYPQLISAESSINYCRNQGYYELSDSDIDRLGFFK